MYNPKFQYHDLSRTMAHPLNQAHQNKLSITRDIEAGNISYSSEGLTVFNRNMHFLDDVEFISAFNKIAKDDWERKHLWRAHVFSWAFKHGCSLPGDLIELGVFKGFYSAIATEYVNFKNVSKELWLVDTWNGVPQDKWNQGYSHNAPYSDPAAFETAKSRFVQYNNVCIVVGSVPEILVTQSPSTISFLHLDMNSAKSEIGALETLFDRLVPGAICLFDDFGLSMFQENCQSSLAWLRNKGYSPVEFPTGQAIVIKR